MIEEEDLVAILKDVAAGGNNDDFSLSSNQHHTPEAVTVSLANQMDLMPAATTNMQQVQQMPVVTAAAAQLPSRQLPTLMPGMSPVCSSSAVVVSSVGTHLPPPTVTATAGPITVKTVTLCQPPLPPPPAMAALEANSFIPTKPIIPFNPAASKAGSSLAAKKVNRPLAPAPPKQLTTAYVRLPVTTAAATSNLAAAVTTQRQRLSSIKKRKSRKSRQLLPAVPTAPTQAVAPITGILQHVLPVQTAASQFAPAAGPTAATTADFDTLYLNSSTSNVSPDSGIQSEGVNSPLHLGDSLHTATAATVAVTASTLSPTLYAQQHQTISMQQLGCNGTVLTSTQTRQAAANWAAAAAAAAPISPQFPAAAGTAFIVQQSSTTQQSQFVQNQTNVAQTTYVYTNGPAPFLVGSATHHTTTSQVRDKRRTGQMVLYLTCL